MKPLTYLAAPHSHTDVAIVQERFEKTNRVAAVLMKRGLLVFSPISHTYPIALAGDLPKGWDFWERFDRAFLSHCNAVIVLTLDGWRESVGVQAEIAIARELGLSIFYCDEEGNGCGVGCG